MNSLECFYFLFGTLAIYECLFLFTCWNFFTFQRDLIFCICISGLKYRARLSALCSAHFLKFTLISSTTLLLLKTDPSNITDIKLPVFVLFKFSVLFYAFFCYLMKHYLHLKIRTLVSLVLFLRKYFAFFQSLFLISPHLSNY